MSPVVSTLALDEFTELNEKLNLEQELRQKAENYAHKVGPRVYPVLVILS